MTKEEFYSSIQVEDLDADIAEQMWRFGDTKEFWNIVHSLIKAVNEKQVTLTLGHLRFIYYPKFNRSNAPRPIPGTY